MATVTIGSYRSAQCESDLHGRFRFDRAAFFVFEVLLRSR
jgi:hypothetical protein